MNLGTLGDFNCHQTNPTVRVKLVRDELKNYFNSDQGSVSRQNEYLSTATNKFDL